ncbi:MAG: molecular chaperone HtpG [Negativicutes bacterium]|nr:molecular chaperone HtpG [Negativicutes bacterium]
MAKREFKTESKRLMELMINSIYTHKEVFLRELISNASDALDKLYLKEIAEGKEKISRDELKIDLTVNKAERTLTIRDNGCGMTEEELIDNLGTIAKSGTLDFRKAFEGETDVIGQFGVGFYSAFMVSSKITVRSKAYGQSTANCWESSGEDGYTLTPCDMESHGTEVTLYLRPDSEDEKYSEYLEQYTLTDLIRKYSDYIRYPIRMEVETSVPKKDNPEEYETVKEIKTINSMIPIWRKQKEDLKDEDYNGFYMDKFGDYREPLHVINTKVEGSVTYNALLFLPSEPPFGYYTKNFEKGLQLYCNGVMIMENCGELLPDYFGFVRGIVDSADFSLNISREMLQHDRQLKLIAKNIEKKLRSELMKMLQEDRAKYEKFWKGFGLQLKYGMYADYGMHKDDLKDLILFHSLKENKLISFQEYVAKMPEEQKHIYYASGETEAKIAALPQSDAIREKGYDILAMTEEVDEFAIKVLHTYDGKEFKSVTDSELGLESEAEKAEIQKKTELNQALLQEMSKALEGKVKAVRLSARLKKHPVCLVNDGELSLEMEKVLNAMPAAEQKVKAERVLEINAEHPLFAVLTQTVAEQPEKIAMYAQLLYDQALLIAGMPIEDPVAFSNAISQLMISQK